MSKTEETFDFSFIADDCESSDGQTRHAVAEVKPVPKNVPETVK